MKNFGLVIHGGAGALLRGEIAAEEESAYREKLSEALQAGYALLENGGVAVDAVVESIRVLEDSPLFNAGRGSVLNSDGICELDAAIMDGCNLGAGAVAGVHGVKNPILLARAVMKLSPHVMMIGEGAEQFARESGLELVPNSYFKTERQVKELERAKKWGTVGAVALDLEGNLAAGTSTGGMTNKRFGRVGDSPIIGAGTYANNATCAVSCTGHGEYFIRAVAAYDISSRIEHQAVPLADAAGATLGKVVGLGGEGGLIAIDQAGRVAMPFNTPGMYRGVKLSSGRYSVAIYGDD